MLEGETIVSSESEEDHRFVANGLSLPLVEISAFFVLHLFSVSFLPFLFPFVASLYHLVFDLLSFSSFFVDLHNP